MCSKARPKASQPWKARVEGGVVIRILSIVAGLIAAVASVVTVLGYIDQRRQVAVEEERRAPVFDYAWISLTKPDEKDLAAIFRALEFEYGRILKNGWCEC